MIEEFAVGDEVGGLEEGAEASTDGVDIDPLIVFAIEPFFLLKQRIQLLCLFESFPFFFEVISFFFSCFEDTSIDKLIELFALPEGYDVDIFGEVFGHFGPNTIFID